MILIDLMLFICRGDVSYIDDIWFSGGVWVSALVSMVIPVRGYVKGSTDVTCGVVYAMEPRVILAGTYTRITVSHIISGTS